MATVGKTAAVRKKRVIEWKIKDFFSLPEENGRCYFSSSFDFVGESWNLSLVVINDLDIYFDLYLIRKKSYPFISLKCILGLKTADGKNDQESHHIHVFDKVGNKCGIHRFIAKSELLERRCDFVPADILTLFCSLRCPIFAKDLNCTSKYPIVFRKNKILWDYKELFLRKEDCDVILNVKGEEFPAHSTILRARSPVFASTYQCDTKEKATGIINIEDCEPSSFSDFLCFLYCGDSEVISTENVFSLFIASDKYDVGDLRAKCVEVMKENVSIDTFCDTIVLAMQHCETELINIATDFFTNHALEIAKTVKWQKFAANNPTQSNELFIKALAFKGSNK